MSNSFLIGVKYKKTNIAPDIINPNPSSTYNQESAAYGGVSKKTQDKKIAKGVDVVVACPGRLLDHIREKTINN